MSDLVFPVNAIVGTLDGDASSAGTNFFAQVLLFPEASVLAPRRPRLNLALSRHVKEILGRTPPVAVYRRRRVGEPAVGETVVTMEAARTGGHDDDTTAPPVEAWTQPVDMRFHVVRWRHGEQASIAFVPALDIEVIGADDQELDERLPVHIRAALLRNGAGRSLRTLAQYQRISKLELHPIEVNVPVRSAKSVAQEASREPKQRPVIDDVGVDLARQTLPKSWELEPMVASLADALTGRNPRSVLLVGKAGVGKTSAVYELVRRRDAFQLGQTPFWATSGARLVAGMSGFGMWQERCQRLCREASKARAVLYLGNLIELMEVGRSTHNAQGIASFLRPYIGRGEILVITECTPEQLSVLERQDPHTLEVFTQIQVDEPTPETCRTILLHELLSADPTGPTPMDDAALEAVDALHRRYATYSAFPARPVRFVRNLLRDRKSAKSTQTISRRDVLAAFARETGLPLMLLDEHVPLDLGETRQRFSSRVIGQGEAVDLVCDLIATVKAAMSRPRRPIASLLFIGPTGVGKTEMAKALAEFFFGDATRLVRFDMSEYATPAAVERLVGGSRFESEGLLTARVREQPFCVVLLDEFEKAHAALFDLMLQVLGEGRLTDAAGRVADFGNAVVVMTSNLGAQSFRQTPFGLRPTQDGGASDAKRHFVDAIRDHFRPEMFNRIDRVVPFAPLGAEVILNIARREIDLVRRRDGIKLRGVELEVTEDAVRYLASRGFDARYGARPLKRAIERELLVPLGEGLNVYAEDLKVVARADMEAGNLKVSVRAAGDGQPEATAAELKTSAFQWTSLRRLLQRLDRSPAVTDMRNELFALQRLKHRLEAMELARLRTKKEAGQKVSMFVHVDGDPRLAKLPRLKQAGEALEAFTARVTEIETTALLALAGDVEPSPDLEARFAELLQEYGAVLLSIYSLRFANPDRATLAFFGQNMLFVYDLARAYYDFARGGGAEVQVWTFQQRPRTQWKKADVGEYERAPLDTQRQTPEAFFDERRSVHAIALVVRGPHAYARLAGERGSQVFRDEGKVEGIVDLDVSGEPWAKYVLPKEADRPDLLDPKQARRTYDLDKNVAHDANQGNEFRWTGRQWASVVAKAAELQLSMATGALLSEGAVT